MKPYPKDQKELWEFLAHKNPRYYVDSSHGRYITDGQLDGSGKDDFTKYVATDELLLERGAFLGKKEILEIGCGMGRMTKYLASCFYHVIGIDISGEMIRYAIDRLKGIHNVTLFETDGYSVPLEDNSVDFAFSYLVFQHFRTKEMIEANFKEVFRVLKPGGLFKVRVRTDKNSMKVWWAWWGGVECDETVALKAGFKLLKKEKVGGYGLWLWLEKPIDTK